MKNLLIILLLLTGCTGKIDVDVSDSQHTIHVDNPIIEFCERLYPEVLYPDEIERETYIVECMQLCQESGECQINFPTDEGNI